MKSIYFAIILICITLSNCTEDKEETKSHDIEKLCTQLDTAKVETLEGVLSISSTGNFLFSSITYKDKWNRRVHLIPCSEDLENYVQQTYDSYLYLRTFNEAFWVSIEGQYLTSDTLDKPQEFVFSFITLMDELEIKTDSSHALRQIFIRK